MTTTATWSVDNTAIATVGAATGLATGVAEGSVAVSAVKDGIIGTTADLNDGVWGGSESSWSWGMAA